MISHFPCRLLHATYFICNGVVPLTPKATWILYHFAFHPVSFGLTFLSMACAILPNSVFMPVPTTTARARPLVIWDPAYTMLSRSPRGMSASSKGSECFATGRDSPVSRASSASRLETNPSRRRPSAGTILPGVRRMMSPLKTAFQLFRLQDTCR